MEKKQGDAVFGIAVGFWIWDGECSPAIATTSEKGTKTGWTILPVGAATALSDALAAFAKQAK